MSFVFKKCHCCGRNFNTSKLIELDQSSVVIGDETLDFAEILLDVCFISIDPSAVNHICDECKNQLVNFHMFKRDCKKYSSFQSHINRVKILMEIDEHLKNFQENLQLQVVSQENGILITSGSFQQEIQVEKLQDEAVNEESVPEPENFEQANDSDMVEEEYIYEDEQETTEIQEKIQENPVKVRKIEKVESANKQKRTKKYKYPIFTNEHLTEDQREWISKQVRACETTLENGKIIYECSMCPTVLKIPGSLKKHLRDCHILKSDKEINVKESQRSFRDEVAGSKLLVEVNGNQETIWRCQRCNVNRIFHSETGLKFHIRFQHIRSGQIDTKFIAQCKSKSEDGKDVWICPVEVCSKVLRSRDGLRNHIKLEHADVFKEEISKDEPPSKGLQRDILDILAHKRRTLKTEQLICDDCGVEFVSGTNKKEKILQNHMDCHKILNIVSQFYQLPKCDDSKVMFSNEEDLNKFLTSDQPYFESLPCEGMTSKVSEKIREPLGTGSDDLNSWKCGHCAAKYSSEMECISHIMILHSTKLICPIDYLEFSGNRGISLFNHHMQNKHPEMFPDFQVTCSYCNENFQTIYDRISHMKTCSEKKHQCDHCGKFFFTKAKIARHLKIEFGLLRYECDICQKSCVSTMDLKLHRASHTNMKSYFCSYPDCNKAFKTPAARSSHLEKHSSIGFSCTNCSLTFKQRTLLQRHLKKCPKKNSGKDQIVFEEVFM